LFYFFFEYHQLIVMQIYVYTLIVLTILSVDLKILSK
jgi:hypothetical protein